MVTGVVPSPPRFLPSLFIAHRVQHSHCSSICHRVLLTHALALSASQFVHKKKSQRIYTSMHSAGLELTKLTYTRLEVNLMRHRGDRSSIAPSLVCTTHSAIRTYGSNCFFTRIRVRLVLYYIRSRRLDDYVLNEDTHTVIRAIGVSHTACKYEFRQKLRSHSWSVYIY